MKGEATIVTTLGGIKMTDGLCNFELFNFLFFEMLNNGVLREPVPHIAPGTLSSSKHAHYILYDVTYAAHTK